MWILQRTGEMHSEFWWRKLLEIVRLEDHEDIIKMNTETGYEKCTWMELAQDRVQ
jgi:hypothetical protein